jgi:uncharacterized damage-inducible protein DinB
MEVMDLETRKINLINWISSVQEEEVLARIEMVQRERADWWETVSSEDQKAIQEGIDQLDKGEYITRLQVRGKIKEKYNF